MVARSVLRKQVSMHDDHTSSPVVETPTESTSPAPAVAVAVPQKVKTKQMRSQDYQKQLGISVISISLNDRDIEDLDAKVAELKRTWPKASRSSLIRLALRRVDAASVTKEELFAKGGTP